MYSKLKNEFTHRLKDSLYLNSIFLILTMGAMAGFGFIFWLINAKLFSTNDIGVATAIIPTATMIGIGSLFGLDSSVVRFINNREKRNEFIRSSFLLVAALSIAGSVLFALFSPLFSLIISTFFSNQANFIIFAILSVATTLNLLSDAIFLANRKTFFTFAVTTTHSFLRIIFPFFFAGFGAGGILLAAMIAQLIGLALNVYVLQARWNYFDAPTISFHSLEGIWRYTTHNYIASLLTLLPSSIEPIIIVNKIGTAESAYFYVVTMVINLLYVIPGAATKSLFAEGSQGEANIVAEIRKSVSFILLLTIPAIFVLLISAEYILKFFGADYADNGVFLLKLLCISVIPYGVYLITNAIFRIKKKAHYLLISTVLLSFSEVTLAFYLAPKGLEGIGYAILLSITIAAAVGLLLGVRMLSKASGRR